MMYLIIAHSVEPILRNCYQSVNRDPIALPPLRIPCLPVFIPIFCRWKTRFRGSWSSFYSMSSHPVVYRRLRNVRPLSDFRSRHLVFPV